MRSALGFQVISGKAIEARMQTLIITGNNRFISSGRNHRALTGRFGSHLEKNRNCTLGQQDLIKLIDFAATTYILRKFPGVWFQWGLDLIEISPKLVDGFL